MYTEAVQTLAAQAVAKLEGQRRSLAAHLVRSALAGMYVGAAIVLIFTIGGSLAAALAGRGAAGDGRLLRRRPDHRRSSPAPSCSPAATWC